jgi:hypothetical protein
MASVSITEAQAKLPDLIHDLLPGDEVVITENNRPVARACNHFCVSCPSGRLGNSVLRAGR